MRNTQLRLGPTAVRQPNQPGYAQPRLLLIRTRHFIRACAVCLPCATSSTWTWLLHNGRGGPRDQTPGAFFIAASPLRGTPLFDHSAEQFLAPCVFFTRLPRTFFCSTRMSRSSCFEGEIVGEKSFEIHYRLFLFQLLPFSIIHTELGLDFYGRMELSYLYQPLSSHDARLNSDYPLRVRDLSNCAQ